jgi:formylglycine-generating enzyme required for sulfatase activity
MLSARLGARLDSGALVRTFFFFALLCAVFLSSKTITAQSVPLVNPELTGNQTFRFTFQAAVGATYPVEVSDDLIHWYLLTNVVGNGAPFSVQDDASSLQRGYYHIGVHPTPIPNMVYIQPGSFTMGSPASEPGRGSIEGPQTVVTLTRGFWMGKFEVTQEDFEAVTGAGTASVLYGPWMPVDFANWSNATNYCQKLTARETAAGRLPVGFSYRLPTEAEWEYACRAGTTNAFAIGNGTSLSSEQANFDGGFPAGGAPVGKYRNATTVGGTFAPNGWGLYDMHGNCWEWCQDLYGPYPGGSVTDPKGASSGTNHVLRGGGYTSVGNSCRSAKRDNRAPSYSNFGQGIRVVLAKDP